METQYLSRTDLVWINRNDPMPNTCCDCGLFTDHNVYVKHVDLVPRAAKQSDGCAAIMLGLFFHVALGPVGWLLAALMEGDETGKTKIVKQKSKIRITQCRLCHGMLPPEVVESRDSRFAFLVNSRFKTEFEQLKRKTESQAL